MYPQSMFQAKLFKTFQFLELKKSLYIVWASFPNRVDCQENLYSRFVTRSDIKYLSDHFLHNEGVLESNMRLLHTQNNLAKLHPKTKSNKMSLIVRKPTIWFPTRSDTN